MKKIKVAILGIKFLKQIKEVISNFYEFELHLLKADNLDHLSSDNYYDIIFVDLSENNIEDIVEKFKEIFKHIPVVVISDIKDSKRVYEYISSGLRDWITYDEIYKIPALIHREILWAKEKKVHNLNMKYMRESNQITGLPNFEGISRKIEEMFRGNDMFAFLLMEIKSGARRGFGDIGKREFVSKVADIILSKLKPQDILSHIEEDKFALITKDIISIPEMINDIHETINSNFLMKIDFHAGVSVFPYDATELSGLLRFSQAALIKSKESGKILSFYSISISEEIKRLDLIVENLKNIKSRDIGEIFSLRYQPIFNLKNGSVFAYEVLLRPKTFDGKVFSIPEILRTAMELNVLYYIEEWVLYESFRKAKILEEKGLKVSVNVSPEYISSRNIYKTIRDIADSVHANFQSIILELTEDALVDETKKDEFDMIRDDGMSITIDDFGTKYNSLRYLRWIPADIIKIDYELIKDVPRSQQDKALISAIINFSHDIGKVVIAEGVEREDQLAFLRSSGCDFAQGFLLGKPILWEDAFEVKSLKI
ncbi:MAG: EAL domain-containing protein [bacterium]|nr:EAL domain-containing protein [bacterium]